MFNICILFLLSKFKSDFTMLVPKFLENDNAFIYTWTMKGKENEGVVDVRI